MKIRSIAIAATLGLCGSLALAPAQAKHRHHHHHKHMMTTGMDATGPSGPGQDAGAPDKSRPAGKGVNRKPAS